MKRKFAGLVVLALLVLPLTALADDVDKGQDVCPEGADIIKVEDINALSYTFTPPEGTFVLDNCFKAANELVYGYGPTVENTTVFNKNGKLQEISHASFRIAEIEDDEDPVDPEEPTTTTTMPEETTTTTEATTTTDLGDDERQPENTTTTTVRDTSGDLPFTGVSLGMVALGWALGSLGLLTLLWAGRRPEDS